MDYSKYENIRIGNPDYIDKNYKRISKDRYFLNIAKAVSARSHDSETQHGCVIVKNGRIISTGYNGFPPGSPDDIIPNIRKDRAKYRAINHAEISAIFACAKEGVSLNDSIAYITGMPCCECAKALVSVGIKEWVIGDIEHVSTDEENLWRNFWIEYYNVKVRNCV